MTSHVVLGEGSSYRWEECENPDVCISVTACLVHHEWAAVELNSYPRRWVESVLGFAVEDDAVFYHDAEGRKHCVDGPAWKSSESVQWFQHGVLHRVDGPAYVVEGFMWEWWLNGKQHRVGGPATEYWDGGAWEWWMEGERHPEEGPSQEGGKVLREWYRHGLRHRDDGPAVVHTNGTQEWWLDGVQVDEATVSGAD